MNNLSVAELVGKLSEDILKDIPNLNNTVLVGIVSRGFPLAQRVADIIKEKTGINLPIGKLDITLYRDDLENNSNLLSLQETLIPSDLENKKVILFDDVLYSGRTVRAAINHLLDYGRPSLIKLAVLVDRQQRELPISADYIGTCIKSTSANKVKIKLKEFDGKDEILVL